MLHHEAKWSARFIQPGKPWQNGFVESFYSTLRRDHVDFDVFYNLLDAELKPSIYTNDTDPLIPDSALVYKVAAEVETVKAGSLMMQLG